MSSCIAESKAIFFRSLLTLENQNIRVMYRDIRGQQTTTTLHRKSNQARQKAPQVTFFGEGSCWTQLLPFIFKYSFKHNFIDPFGEKLCCCSVSVTREITQFWKCKINTRSRVFLAPSHLKSPGGLWCGLSSSLKKKAYNLRHLTQVSLNT